MIAAATCQIQCGTGSSVSWANAEGGIAFSREDTLAGTTTVPIPNVTGTNFSWVKHLVLAVTGTGTTNITNRCIRMSGSPSTGLAMFYLAQAVASYAQASSGTMPTASGSNGATPSGYTAMTTSAVQYDNTSVATSSTGPNGSMANCVLGVDHTFVGGANTATSLPSIIFTYDEA